MKNSIRFWAATLALILALSLGLSGCTPIFRNKAPKNGESGALVSGGQANVDSEGRPFETVYVAELFDFDRPVGPFSQMTSSPDGLYVYDGRAEMLCEFDGEGRCLRELGDVKPDWIAPDGSVWGLDDTEDRNARHIDYTVFRDSGSDKTQVLSFRTERGTAELTLGDGFFLITKLCWDESNVGHYAMDTYDFSGNLLHSQELSEWHDIYRDRADIYFFGHDSYGIFLYDPQSHMLNKVDSLDEDCSLNGISGGMLYMNDQLCVYRRPIGSAGREALFRYDALYFSPGLSPIPIGNSGRFFFSDFRNEISPYKIACPVDKNAVPAQRQAVVLAINDPSVAVFNKPYGSSYWEAIADFNTVSRDYEIIVKNYYDCPDPQTALNVDVSAGAVPDLIDLEGFSGSMVTVSNAEDLLPWFERDYGTDALLPGPLKAMETDGRLLSLMPSFSVTAILAPAALVDGQQTGSFADLAALAGGAEHVFYNSVDRESFLRYVFASDLRNYTADQIADILSFAALLPEQALQNPYDYPEEEVEQMAAEGLFFGLDHRPIQAGLQKFELAAVSGPVIGIIDSESMVGIAQEEGYFGEGLTALGLPGSSGSGVFLRPVQELMMPTGAGNKDGAWEFMKFLLHDRYLTDLTYGRGFRSAIPLTRSAFEQGANAWKDLNGVISGSINDVEYSLTYDPKRCDELFQKLLDAVDGVLRDGDEIYSTLAALAQSYFSGDKPLEQVSADIASRLRTYQAERG